MMSDDESNESGTSDLPKSDALNLMKSGIDPAKPTTKTSAPHKDSKPKFNMLAAIGRRMAGPIGYKGPE